ncbi:MAG: membrane or secreted protein [Cyclobacteriaceae bacterium]|nr:membrane or secreted protein [Cyclobacteriaceae bacterium]
MCATSITTLAGTNLSPSLNGAWLTTYTNEDGKAITGEATFMEGYFSMAAYAVATKEFYYTKGGRYTVKENQLSLTWEFNTQDKSQVGKLVTETIQLKKDKLELGGHSWQRLDDGTPGVLAGAWLITGRKRNGELTRSTPGVRKTMKILSGTRFQWIAYNTETGEFFGTGGGTYTTKDGNYTENIEFFSRDASRVGVSLPFEYTLEDGEWHHSGLTSKGQPMYEIWTPRSRLE